MIYTLTLNPALDRELTVPAIEYDAVLRATQSQIDFGGKGFNVSRQLKNLGVTSTAVGFLGGRTGEMLQDGLRAQGIETDFIWLNDGETRTNISIVTPGGEHYIKVNEKGPLVSKQQQAEMISKVKWLAKPGDWWVLSGSLPPGLPDSFLAQLIALLNNGGAQVLLDTTGAPLHLGCQAGPFLVKPNAHEAQELTGLTVGSFAEAQRAAAEICRIGAQNVLLSLGRSGALLQTQSQTWLARCPSIEEKNPIGAGDAMLGGMLWALTNHLALQEAFAWGAACGTAAASLHGTGMGPRQLVEQLLAQVQIKLFSPSD